MNRRKSIQNEVSLLVASSSGLKRNNTMEETITIITKNLRIQVNLCFKLRCFLKQECYCKEDEYKLGNLRLDGLNGLPLSFVSSSPLKGEET